MKPFYRSLFLLLFSCLFFAGANAQTADFSSDVVSGCNPLVVSFTDKTAGATSSIIYAWDFGNGSTSTLKNPSTTYITSGTFTVKLTVKNGSSGTPSVKTKTIIVYPSPTVNYTVSPLSGCPCTNVSFTNTSVANAPGAMTSIWSFGDGYTATTSPATHNYCTPGKYDIALKVTNSAGCVATKLEVGKVEIWEKPVGDFNASLTDICKIPDSTFFTAYVSKGKSPYVYSWDFGDGTALGAGGSLWHKYTVGGTYTVRLIVTDANGCKDTNTKVNFIKAVPMKSNFTVPSSICAGVSQVLFTSSSVPSPKKTTWKWSDGSTVVSSFSQRDFWAGGAYSVTMVDSFGLGCIDSATKTYSVFPKPKPNFSYSPIYPCPAPATINFVDKSSGADTLLWVFGDGTTSKTRSPSHTYTWDSVFTVYLIAKTTNGCLDTFRVRDTSKAFPGGYAKTRYDSSNSPIIVRVYDAFMEINVKADTNCIPKTYTFSPFLSSNVHLPSAIDTSTPISKCGVISGYFPPYWFCSALPLPDPYSDEFIDRITWTTSFEPPVIGYPYYVRSAFYDYGDGATGTTGVHTYTTEGRFMVKITLKTDSCTFTDSIEVEAGNKPTASFTVAPDTICKGDYVTITNSSVNGKKYTWFWDDETTTIDTSIVLTRTHVYKKAGDKRIQLLVDRYGCTDTMSKLIIMNPPFSSYGVRYSCDTLTKVMFTDSSYRATSVKWYFGDGDSSTLRNPIHIYPDTGIYYVKMVTKNDSFPCIDTSFRTIRLFNISPKFVAEDTTICRGDTVWLNEDRLALLDSTYWDTPKGSLYLDSATVKYYILYSDTGRFSITYYARDIHKCLHSFTRNNYITISKPWPSIIASPLISCMPSSVIFDDASTNTSGVKNVIRTWRWGDGTFKTDSTKKATKIYSAIGEYTVKMIVADEFGCKDSTDILIKSRKPSVGFSAVLDTFACIGRPIKFYSSSGGFGLSYKWDFGDGSTSTATDPVYAYSAVGTYNVKLVVTDETGCKDSLTKLAYVKITKPTAGFTLSDSVALCPPLFVSISNTTINGVSYAWDFANGSASIAPSPTTLYIDSGVYNIRLVATNKHGCTDTAYKKARVLGYNGLLKYSPLEGCRPLTVFFEAEEINAPVMVWDFADGVTESAVGKLKTSHTYTKAGAYVPRLILGDGLGCSTSSQGIDTIKVDGINSVVSSSPQCVNTEITLNDSSYSFYSIWASSFWTFDDGTTSTDKNPKRLYSKPGNYPIKLITTNTNGCMDTLQTNITVHPLPNVKANDTVICLNDKATLSATGAAIYYWLPDATLSCSDCNNPITSTVVPINYIVLGTDEFGCKNYDTLTVGIKTKTTLILADNAEACSKKPLQLLASGAQNYIWTPSKYLDNPNIPNPIATADSSIMYRVIATEGSCIPDTGYLDLTVHPLPIVNAGQDQRVLAGTEVQLSGSGTNIEDYLWTPSENLSCKNCPNPIVKPAATTTFTLKGTSKYGCSDSDDVMIVIFCDQSQLFIPNTFTPNGDGQNDYFYPQGKGVAKVKSFIIYNRWGQKVFERNNMDANMREQGWDGTFQGKALNPDTFVYTLEATCDNGEEVFWKGDVTIIK